jgi:hypothetical protein
MIPVVHLELKMASRNSEEKKIQMVVLGKSEVGGRWFMKKPEAKNLVTLSLGKTAAGLRKAVGP